MAVSSSQGLHPTAAAMYRFIIRYKRQNAGDSPTRREIAAGMGVQLAVVQHHLAALEATGRIARPKRGKARLIVIPGATWVFDEVGAERARANKCAVGGEVDGVAERPEEE